MKPSHGDVTAEYRAIHDGVALVRDAHDLLWVEGPDAGSFLQGILSQDIEAIGPGGVGRSLLLSPQGKLQALLWLAVGEDRVGIVTDGGLGAAVAEALGYYRIRVKAEIRADDRPVHELWGPDAPELGGTWTDDGHVVRIDLSLPGLRRILVAGGTPPPEAVPAGALAVTASRVEVGEPVMGRDVDEKTIPQEAGITDVAVSFTKGCYLGQELVARIDSRGRVNRHLRGIVLRSNVLPPEGAVVAVGTGEVGTVTSVSESLAVKAPIGLSLVRREVEPGSEVTIRWEGGEAPAVVEALPLVGNTA